MFYVIDGCGIKFGAFRSHHEACRFAAGFITGPFTVQPTEVAS